MFVVMMACFVMVYSCLVDELSDAFFLHHIRLISRLVSCMFYIVHVFVLQLFISQDNLTYLESMTCSWRFLECLHR